MMTEKKVVILGPAYPLRGGLAAYNERLAREFQKLGWQVSIYTFSLQYPSILFPGQSQYSDSPPPAGLEIFVKVNSINPLNWLRIGQKIKKFQPDLLVMKFWLPFMGPCLGTIARMVRSNDTTRCIAIIDNIIPHEKRLGDRWLAQYFAKAMHGFVYMSAAVGEELKLFVKKQQPTKFVYHPIYDNYGFPVSREDALHQLNLDPKYHYILFFGFIRDYKGLDLLLKAMNHPGIREAGIKLIIAGEYYTAREPYDDLIKGLNLADLVVDCSDFIPDEQVRYYFGVADLVVQPYKSATQSGISQIAYHFEKPMVVTAVGGLPEIVPDNQAGYVVDSEPEAIGTAILKFFRLNKQAVFAETVRQRKHLFSWQAVVSAIIRVSGK